MPIAVGIADLGTEDIAHVVAISRSELIQQSLEPHINTPFHQTTGFGLLFRSPKSWLEYRKKKGCSQ